ncbi:MAG: GDP-mannose 4,6-dehydratase [Patescibacteria group bacterium]|nr:GDP-mannose 4,6-dehydratase [Patescibacteria group bacterium]
MKKAFITGISGQDGSYLAEFLLEKGYEVHGTISGKSDNAWRIENIKDKINLYECDVREENKVIELVKKIIPDEIYHLASSVETRILFEEEQNILKTNFESTHFFLRAIKLYSNKSKFFLAGSSLMFGDAKESPQNENTPLRPNTPYGIAKTAGFYLAKMYREAYGIFACTGILYNHESPRRDFNFLPRKITRAAARIKAGKEKELALGNIEARRDWGFAGDYVEAMWLMLQTDKADDYVIGTGKIHSVKDILDIVFEEVGLDWKNYVVINKELFRKERGAPMVADISKIKSELKWQPKTSLEELIKMMVQEDLKLAKEIN